MDLEERSDELLVPFLMLMDSVFAAVLVETLLYGMHVILFCICATILIMRRNTSQLVILLSAIIMFAFATADIALSFRLLLRDFPAVLRQEMDVNVVLRHIYPKNPLFVTNNLIADGLLLYRCSMVWGGRRYVVFGSACLLIADTVWGYVGTETTIFSLQKIFTPAFLWSVFSFNVIMTAATAGRIWWLARTTRPLIGEQELRRYSTAVAILLESGAIYSISVILLVVIPPKPYRLIFVAIVIRVVGIIPTLMIVQIELGRKIRGLDVNSAGIGGMRLGALRAPAIISSPVNAHGVCIDIRSNRSSSRTGSDPGEVLEIGTVRHSGKSVDLTVGTSMRPG